MTTSFSVDHFVIAVRDLGAAVESYTNLGFTVTPGGRHTHAPTHNALIYFADGSYFELIGWLGPAAGEKWHEALSRHGDGLVDFALVPADLPAAVQAANASRPRYSLPVDGSRINPDGQNIRWQLAWPLSYALPFLCGDITPRRLRVPEGQVRIHPNGVTGVSSIAIRVHDLAQAAEDYRALLEADPSVRFEPIRPLDSLGLEVLSLSIASTHLNLVAPSNTSGTALARAVRHELQQRGEGPYKLILRSPPGAQAQTIDLANSHGVSLWLTPGTVPIDSQV